MNVQYMTSSELKTRAKDLLDGRYGSAILILFLGNMVAFALSTICSTLFGGLQLLTEANGLAGTLISVLISSAISLFTNIFSAGYALFFLNMACRRSCDVSNLFYGYRWQFSKCMTVSAFFTGVNLVCMLPYQICFALFRQTQEMGWLMAAMLTISAALIILTVFSLVYSQCYYLMLDFPDYSAKQLLSTSRKLMKGHKGRLFYLQVSFIPLTLLALLTCGIGMLWLSPYMHMTYTCFFLDLMNPRRVAG
ncbi:MAG: DUF975 family protein [Lachnospiraceae bacterium]|nr:DUF975 family protein [Lachnospiraceae bacterium]